MSKENCWEVKECGREINGKHINKLGVCPAAKAKKADGINHGSNGGRVCWALAGTFCNDKIQGTFAAKIQSCIPCQFYQQVKQEELGTYVSSIKIMDIIK